MPMLYEGFWTRALAVVSLMVMSSTAVGATGGAGASLPYVEIQGENAATNGSVLPITTTTRLTPC
jgi:hypothetical protein